jgi:ribosomal protein L12E/L44/L45/RPP1/RPP2
LENDEIHHIMLSWMKYLKIEYFNINKYMAEKEQLAVSYAAFVLAGAGAEVTADSLNAVLHASGVAANSTLVSAVAKALKGRTVTDFFGGVGSGPAESAPATTPAAEKAAKPAAKPADKPAPPPPPKEEEEDMDMGGLFD